MEIKIIKASAPCLFLAFLLAFPVISHAQWQGPATVLALTEGNGTNQIGIGHDETNLGENAHNFCVDDQGNIIIADSLNARILIFGADGTLKKAIPKPVLAGECPFWPGRMLAHPNGQRIFVFGQSECVYDFAGNIHKCFPDPFGPHGAASAYAVPNGFILGQTSYYGSDYWSVDLEGNLVGKLPERPLELGRFETENGKKYLKFPNVSIPAGDIHGFWESQLLPDGNVLIDGGYLYSAQGVKLGTLQTPPQNPAQCEDCDYTVYTGPVTDTKGDIYYVKYTPGHYTILKWTYVGPEAAAKSKSSTAPESKSTAKPTPSTKPSAKAATSDVKQPAEQKPEATAKPPAKEGKKATPEIVQKEQKKDEGK